MKRVSIAALVLLGGCKEDPSWAARWRIEPRPGMELETTTNEEGELLNSVQCSRVGVSVIRFASVTSPFPECRAFTTQEECGPGPDASDGDTDGGSDTGDDGGGSACRWVPGNPGGCVSAGALADLREKPCFSQALENPNAVLGGPKLVPGLYEVIATATRSNGAAWVECFVADDGEEYCGDEGLIPRCIDTGDGPRCQEGYLSCDCRFIEVKEDVTLRVDDLVLGAPPECEDGIDSDLDGLVDQRDPGCQGGDREDRNVVNAQLVIDFSLLSNHPLVSCTGVGLSEYVVFLDDEEVGRTDCRIGAFGLNLDIEPGEHTIRVEGLGFDGAAATEPQTFDVLALAAGVLDPALLEVDFGDDDFIEPDRGDGELQRRLHPRTRTTCRGSAPARRATWRSPRSPCSCWTPGEPSCPPAPRASHAFGVRGDAARRAADCHASPRRSPRGR